MYDEGGAFILNLAIAAVIGVVIGFAIGFVIKGVSDKSNGKDAQSII